MLCSDKLLRMTTSRYLQKSLQAYFCSTKTSEGGENAKPAKEMSKDLTKETDIKTKVKLTNMVTAKDMQWRKTWQEREGDHYNLFRVLGADDNKPSTVGLELRQRPINLTPTAIKKWWMKRKENKEKILQQYIPERNQALGNELAAAHFIVYRRGSVKFYNNDSWIKQDEYGEYTLPAFYEDDKILQAIDCSHMKLYYEGLENLRNLHQVEWFSINGCNYMDDWCLDTISNIFSNSLLYLDIRDCPKITDRGLGALCKMKKLKLLHVDDMFCSSQYELTCLMLQELIPDLEIRSPKVEF